MSEPDWAAIVAGGRERFPSFDGWSRREFGLPPLERAVDPRCRYKFPLPSWAGEDQMDPCRCDLANGHDGEHSCPHIRKEVAP